MAGGKTSKGGLQLTAGLQWACSEAAAGHRAVKCRHNSRWCYSGLHAVFYFYPIPEYSSLNILFYPCRVLFFFLVSRQLTSQQCTPGSSTACQLAPQLCPASNPCHPGHQNMSLLLSSLLLLLLNAPLALLLSSIAAQPSPDQDQGRLHRQDFAILLRPSGTKK